MPVDQQPQGTANAQLFSSRHTAVSSPDQPTSSPLDHLSGNTLFVLAALVIVVAGMKAAEQIVVPLLMSSFIAILAGTPVAWLHRNGVPRWLSIIMVLLALLALFFGLGLLIGQTVRQFLQELPFYQARVSSLGRVGADTLDQLGYPIDVTTLTKTLDPGAVMALVGSTLQGFGNALSNSLLILLAAIFILAEASSFPHKLRMTLKDADGSLPHFERFTATVNRYMAIKTTVSLITGVLIWAWLAVLGVDFALLWGLLAFLLNYVPNIGSILAAVPAVLLAMVQLGPTSALLAAAGFAAVNIVLGNFVEPRFMGKGLGLSTLVVFFSLVFWGWVLGPVGMLLSVPLTITVKIALEVNPRTYWLAVLLGPEDDLPPLPEAAVSNATVDGEPPATG